MKLLSSSGIAAALAAVGLFAQESAQAINVVSVSVGNTSINSPLTSTPVFLASDVAGVVAVANWNETDGSNPFALAGTLKDDTGALVPGLSFTSTGNQDTYNYGGATGNQKLMSSFIKNNSTTVGVTLNLAGIPYAAYDLILYTDSFGGSAGTPNVQNFVLNQTTLVSNDTTIFIASQTFTEGLNFVRFNNLTGPTQALRILPVSGPDPSSLQGFQIVERAAAVPEPASMLLGLIATGALALRRGREQRA